MYHWQRLDEERFVEFWSIRKPLLGYPLQDDKWIVISVFYESLSRINSSLLSNLHSCTYVDPHAVHSYGISWRDDFVVVFNPLDILVDGSFFHRLWNSRCNRMTWVMYIFGGQDGRWPKSLIRQPYCRVERLLQHHRYWVRTLLTRFWCYFGVVCCWSNDNLPAGAGLVVRILHYAQSGDRSPNFLFILW